MSKELKKFQRVTTISSSGELMANAGRYSRGAVIAAFEMNGGIEAFAEWADENKTDFYTKMFSKLIGRETESKSQDDLEDLLTALDGEATEIIVEQDKTPPVIREEPDIPEEPDRRRIMARAAKAYSKSEPEELT